MDDMIPIADAAAMLGLSLGTLRLWAADGKIPGAVQQGAHRMWFVPRAEVGQLLREEREHQGRRSAGEWLDTAQAAQLLGKDPVAVAGWARDGTLAGSVKGDDGRWRVRRSEVERVLAEREAAERRIAKREEFRFTPRSGRRGRNEEAR